MGRYLPIATLLVVLFTILIATTTHLPFWVPLGVLTFNWICAPLIGRWVEGKNPTLRDHERQGLDAFAWKTFAAWMIVFGIAGWLAVWGWGVSYSTGFAYALLFGSTALAVNSIVIDVEDNQKGGWMNP